MLKDKATKIDKGWFVTTRKFRRQAMKRQIGSNKIRDAWKAMKAGGK